MAAKTFYAWTDITYRIEDDPQRKVLHAGSKVTKELLGLDDVRWGELVRTRAVRTDEFPPIDRSTSNVLSVNQYYSNLAKERERTELDNNEGFLTAVLDPDEDS